LYQEVVQRDPADAVLWSNLSLGWERNPEAGVDTRLEQALAAARKASDLDPASREYRDAVRRLDLLRSVAGLHGEKVVTMLPMVTPLAIEVAADLVPLVEGAAGGLSPECEKLFANLREEMLRTYGLRVPGIRVRGNETEVVSYQRVAMALPRPPRLGNPDAVLFS